MAIATFDSMITDYDEQDIDYDGGSAVPGVREVTAWSSRLIVGIRTQIIGSTRRG